MPTTAQNVLISDPGDNEPNTTPYNEHTNQQHDGIEARLSDELHYSEPQWKKKKSTRENTHPELYIHKTKYAYITSLEEPHPAQRYTKIPHQYGKKWNARIKQQMPMNKIYRERTSHIPLLKHKKERYIWSNMHTST